MDRKASMPNLPGWDRSGDFNDYDARKEYVANDAKSVASPLTGSISNEPGWALHVLHDHPVFQLASGGHATLCNVLQRLVFGLSNYCVDAAPCELRVAAYSLTHTEIASALNIPQKKFGSSG